jgi:hypothetical protein
MVLNFSIRQWRGDGRLVDAEIEGSFFGNVLNPDEMREPLIRRKYIG